MRKQSFLQTRRGDEMTLTEQQVIAASGAFPKWTDEELLAAYRKSDRKTNRRGLIGGLSFALMFVFIFSLVACPDPNMDSVFSKVFGVCTFVCLFTFAGFVFSAIESGGVTNRFRFELERRGVAYKDESSTTLS